MLKEYPEYGKCMNIVNNPKWYVEWLYNGIYSILDSNKDLKDSLELYDELIGKINKDFDDAFRGASDPIENSLADEFTKGLKALQDLSSHVHAIITLGFTSFDLHSATIDIITTMSSNIDHILNKE